MPESSVLNEPDKTLFRAISNDNLEGVKEALEVGANPNAVEGHHHTALSRAVVSDNSKIVGHLLDRGADPNARSGSGETPLHYSRFASREVRDQLLTAGANPNGFDKIGQTPLHQAAESRSDPAIITALLDAGADPNRPDELRAQTPLHLAANSNPHAAVVEALLDGGADATLRDEKGRTPGDLAESNSSLKGTEAYRRLKEAR